MKVLSLFDGMSCAQVALNNLGIKDYTYYASEIDKYSITVTQENYPETIQLGDINNFNKWDIPWNEIGLIIAGFPCQSWSVAGLQKGLKDPRGQLALVLLEAFNKVKEHNLNVKFLFENVRMKKENLNYMDNLFGVKHVMINSALITAQNRVRCYWTNIEDIAQPLDRGIVLADIIEDGLVDRDKSYCIDANYFKGTNLKQYFKKARRQVVFNYSSSGRGNGVVESRVREAKKSGALTASGYSNRSFTGVLSDNTSIRKLTPIECERLQGVPDNYTNYVSNTQRYKMLGNGFTVPVIEHILSHVFKPSKDTEIIKQLEAENTELKRTIQEIQRTIAKSLGINRESIRTYKNECGDNTSLVQIQR